MPQLGQITYLSNFIFCTEIVKKFKIFFFFIYFYFIFWPISGNWLVSCHVTQIYFRDGQQETKKKIKKINRVGLIRNCMQLIQCSENELHSSFFSLSFITQKKKALSFVVLGWKNIQQNEKQLLGATGIKEQQPPIKIFWCCNQSNQLVGTLFHIHTHRKTTG